MLVSCNLHTIVIYSYFYADLWIQWLSLLDEGSKFHPEDCHPGLQLRSDCKTLVWDLAKLSQILQWTRTSLCVHQSMGPLNTLLWCFQPLLTHSEVLYPFGSPLACRQYQYKSSTHHQCIFRYWLANHSNLPDFKNQAKQWWLDCFCFDFYLSGLLLTTPLKIIVQSNKGTSFSVMLFKLQATLLLTTYMWLADSIT